MPGLRDILDAATPDWTLRDVPGSSCFDIYVSDSWEATMGEYNARLAALAPELAALCLDMGDYLRDLGATRYGDEPGDVLLARLDQLGKEQT